MPMLRGPGVRFDFVENLARVRKIQANVIPLQYQGVTRDT